MILRITKKLADKLKVKTLQEHDSDINPFEEWYGHLFTANRIQYVIITNASTLYSSISPANGILSIKEFIDTVCAHLCEVLKNDGFGNITEQFTAPQTDIIEAYKTNNRAVLGSMNDMIDHAKFCLVEYDMPVLEISKRLNKAPFSYINNNSPLCTMHLLVNHK